MVSIFLAQSALEDLDAIFDFIAQDSIKSAKEFLDEILNRIQQLGNFPNSGKIVQEFEIPEIREIVYGKYRIIYIQKSLKQIVILRVLHGSRLLEI